MAPRRAPLAAWLLLGLAGPCRSGSPCPRGCVCAPRGRHDDCAASVACRGLAAFPAAEDYPADADCVFLEGPKLAKLDAGAKRAGLRAVPASVRRLDLSACGLGELPDDDSLGRLTRLRVLNLEFNRLKRLPRAAFHGLASLKVLWLTGNHYEKGEREYKKMKALGNRLDALDEDQFQGLGNLQVLLLHHNRLTALPEGVFRDQAKLKVLKLVDNPFQPPLSRGHAAFAGLLAGAPPRLYQLDLDRDSGDALEDHWEETRTYLSDDFFEGPPRRKRGPGRSGEL